MTVTFCRDQAFAGIPFRRFRDLLASWCEGNPVEHAAALSRVSLDRSTASAALDEAMACGWLADRADPCFAGAGPEDACGTPRAALLAHWDRRRGGPRPTVAGIAVMEAKPFAPLASARADEVLGALLADAAALNAAEGMPWRVARVWLYGSHMRREPFVNDVDVVVETERTAAWDTDVRSDLGRRWISMARVSGGESAVREDGRLSAFRALEHLRDRWTLGQRRHPALSPSDVDGLRQVGCPCRLVFDAARGGPVDDPVLDRHPDSAGPGPGLFERLRMPAIPDVPALRPVEAFLVDRKAGYSLDGRGRLGFRLVPLGTVRGLRGTATDAILVEGHEGSGGRPSRWTVRRSVTADGEGYRYSLDLSSVEGGGHAAAAVSVSAYLVDLCRADMERVAMHSLATDGPCTVSLDVTSTAPSPSARAVSVELAATSAEPAFPGPLAAGRLEAHAPGRPGAATDPGVAGDDGLRAFRMG